MGWGVVLAAVLYVGSRAVLWALCGGFSELLCQPLRDVYARFGTGSLGTGLALALVIAPAEELFWRGVVQQVLRPRLGRVWGAVVASWVSHSLWDLLIVILPPAA